MVGDPGGRSEERNLLDDETLAANVAAIKAQIARIVDLDGRVGHARRQPRLDRGPARCSTSSGTSASTSPSTRWWPGSRCRPAWLGEHGISYTEFSYMLLQAHDYLHLHDARAAASSRSAARTSGATSSRASTSSAGVTGHAVHALSWPLLTAADGTKLGKTTGARVWLDPDRTSPYELLPALDADRRRRGRAGILAQFTLLPVAEVDAIVAAHADGAGPRARASGAWPSRSPPSCTGQSRPPRRRRRPPSCSAAIPGVRPPRRSGPWPPRCRCTRLEAGEDLAAGVDLAPVLVRAGPGLVPGRRPPAAEPGRGGASTARRPARSARWGPPTCSTAAGCCCARASGTGRSWTWRPDREKPRDLGLLRLTGLTRPPRLALRPERPPAVPDAVRAGTTAPLRGGGCPQRTTVAWSMLLENRREDEKASAGDCPDPSGSVQPFKNEMHRNTDSSSAGRSGASRQKRELHAPGSPALQHRSTGLTTSVAGPEISMESLILAQDERWRRA